MEECEFFHTRAGTPQGGILSPLFCNIALRLIEERYQKRIISKNWKLPLHNRLRVAQQKRLEARQRNKTFFYPIRYADDFVVLCSGSEEAARTEKHELQIFLKQELSLELAEEKARVTRLTKRFNFLGHHIELYWNQRWGWVLLTKVPRDRELRLKRKIKEITRRETRSLNLRAIHEWLNPILRGWANFYQHASGARLSFARIDQFVFQRTFACLKKKHPKLSLERLLQRYYRRGGQKGWLGWEEKEVRIHRMILTQRGRHSLKNRKLPHYMQPLSTGKNASAEEPGDYRKGHAGCRLRRMSS